MTGTTITVPGPHLRRCADEAINDNLQIVKLTGGTVTVSSDPNNIPLSDKIKDAFSTEIDQAQPQSQTVNIADAVAKNDGKPFRVATVQRGGEWYVSLFYTIADNAVHRGRAAQPDRGRRDPGRGPATPEAAVKALVDAATAGRTDEGVIARYRRPTRWVSCTTTASCCSQQADADALTSDMTDLGVTVDNVTWTTSDVTGGKKVSLKSLEFTADGQTVTITRDAAAGSLTLSVPGEAAVTLDETTIDSYLARRGRLRRSGPAAAGHHQAGVQADHRAGHRHRRGRRQVVRQPGPLVLGHLRLPAQGPGAGRRRLPDQPRRQLSRATGTATAPSAALPGRRLRRPRMVRHPGPMCVRRAVCTI